MSLVTALWIIAIIAAIIISWDIAYATGKADGRHEAFILVNRAREKCLKFPKREEVPHRLR